MTEICQTTVVVDCPDEVGLINKFTSIFYNKGLNIISQDEYVDKDSSHFFMRSVVEGVFNKSELERELKSVVPANIKLNVCSREKKDIILFASKEAHCLGDILIREYEGSLGARICAVVSNHEKLGELVKRFDLPFHYISHKGLSKEEHEAAILETISQYRFDNIVLAKYMRILSKDFTSKFSNKIINIHHSFLPAFIGAKPYHQAHERGVKIIGATAHFVNEELDAGPIIAQDTASVSHSMSVSSMISKGRDVEKIVLANALKLVLEDRVIVHGNKTVVFD